MAAKSSGVTPLQTRVLIIGGGVTGAGLARDLALRGIDCTLIEKADLNAGASGGNHGLLHSGARYIASDPTAAAECRAESTLLKRLAPQCIEETGGLFIAVEGDDESYVADFPRMCAAAGISARLLDIKQAREMEPALADTVIAAYAVDDASVDPFKLTIDNIAHARTLGAGFFPHTRAAELVVKDHRIREVVAIDTRSGRRTLIQAEQVVNAAGAWAGEVAALAGVHLDMIYSKGSLLVTQQRIAHRVINRLRQATDGDILVPGGTVSILGTTSVRIQSPDHARPTIAEVDKIIAEGAAMIPALETARYIRAFCGIRPLQSSPAAAADDRGVSRGFDILDHSTDGVDNLLTITGGKLTTYRMMAEKIADEIGRRTGNASPCKTAAEPLPQPSDSQWTRPGHAPRVWLQNRNPDDIILCECEMVPMSAVDNLVETIRQTASEPGLRAIGLRSRIGKGPCQGAFCSARVTAYLYDRQVFEGCDGIFELMAFLQERWRGQHPIMWASTLMQAELQEAMHCGLLGLEMAQADGEGCHGK